MTDAVTSLRVYTGANAATESAAQTGIDLVSVDNAVNSPSNRDDNQVAPGDNSFEKWLRVKLDTANGKSLTNFWVERSGDLPDDVIVKFGVVDDPATPTDETSTVATTTMHDGRRYIFDVNTYSEDGDATRYLVVQEQVAVTADSGAIETESFGIGWSESNGGF